MARKSNATQINLDFGNSPRQLMNLRSGVCSGNFARKGLNVFRQSGIGKNEKT
jgi:hypothetical protein